MKDIEKENSGMLFYNDDKKSDKAPDWSGQVNIEGKQYRIAGWENEGKNGTFLGLQFSEPEESNDDQPRGRERSSGGGGGSRRTQYTKPSRR